MSIKARLILGFLIIIVLVSIMGIVSYNAFNSTAAINKHTIEALHGDMALDEAMGDKTTWVHDIQNVLIMGGKCGCEMDPDKCKFGVWLKEAKSKNTEFASQYDEMEKSHIKLHNYAKEVLAEYAKGNKEGAVKIYADFMEPVAVELEIQGENISKASMQDVDDDIKRCAQIEKSAIFTITIILIFVIILSIVIALLIIQSITKPINTFIQTTEEVVTTGNLDQKIELGTKDEMGALSKAFQKMLDWMKDTVVSVLSTAETVSSSSQQLSATAQAMNATIEEAASTVQQIAKGAEVQAQKVEETTKVMEGMSMSINSIADNAAKASSASDQSVSSAQSGGKAAKDAVEKMGAINNSVESSSVVVKQLGERSQEIDDIIKVITDIADQTNLLALNAAIEAARAGESGRGFAVVAEEVRKLAEGSAKAADEISKLIRTIKQETESVVKSMDEVSKDVGSGRDVIMSVDSVLAEIMENVQNASAMVREIKEATEEQTAGAKQIVKSVSDIASTSEETAAATEEASASTEEMTSSMEELSASAEELADMAMSLRTLVGRFKVGQDIEFHKPILKKTIKKENKFTAKHEEA
ncbi:MAG: methyl-accepting chemotaxis protein [Armatimonadota bacterium]